MLGTCVPEDSARRVDSEPRAMIDLHEVLPGVHPGARMILQIHDELVFEVPEDEVESVAVLVRERMEKAMDLAVPLLAEPSWGPSWADTK